MSLEELFRKAIEIEKENYEKLSEGTKPLKNVIVKNLLGSIAQDSKKHAQLYEGLIKYLSEIGTALTEEEFEELKKIIDTHIKLEENMIKNIEELLKRENLPKPVRYVLKYMLSDEYRHHALLKGLMEVVVKKEVITEEDWWDLIWKEVPFHGTPGG